ncbi:hypothetical protein SHKM778_54240 [Streptomyces sp. KM77-8]|uniref:Uncharacterized protein n=1 Tax=Streptomyces haneummycinicus TaxID=3074435 RepID=A0AAT9HNJ4_9ACTN
MAATPPPRHRLGEPCLVGDVVHGAGQLGVPLGTGQGGDDLDGALPGVGLGGDDEVGAAGEDGARLVGGPAGHGKVAQLALQVRVLLEDGARQPRYGDDLRDLAVGEHACLRRVFLVGVGRSVAERLEPAVEVHSAQGRRAVERPAPDAVVFLGEFTALVPDEAREGVPVLAREVDALVAVGVELFGDGDPLLAGLRRGGDAGLAEEVLAVDDDPVGRVPGDAVLLGAPLAGFGEAGQPVLAAPVPHGLQGEVEQFVALRVRGDLGVADLDDVGAVRLARSQGALHLLADAGPLLDADVEVEAGVLALELLGEAVQVLLRRAVLHQPHGDRAPFRVAGH